MPGQPQLLHEAGKFTGAHWRIFATTFVSWSLSVCSLILPTFLTQPITRELGLSPMEHAYGLALALAAGAIGGTLGGALGDAYGRRSAASMALVLVGLGDLFAGLSGSFATFLAARAVTGIGVGGAWATGQALLVETAPRRWRDRIAGCLEASAPVGMGVALLLAAQLGPRIGWRNCLVLSSSFSLLAGAACVLEPESDRWHRLAGQDLRKGIVRILAGDLERRFYSALILVAVSASAYWLTYSWLYPSLWAREITKGDAVLRMGTLTLAQIGGYVVFGWVARRYGRRPAFTAFATTMAIGLLWLAALWTRLAPYPPYELAALALVGVGTGNWSHFGPLLATLFPTAVRATAMGSIFSIARAAPFALPVYIVAKGARHGLDAGIVPAAALACIAAILIWAAPEEADELLPDGEQPRWTQRRPRRFRLHTSVFVAAVSVVALGLVFATGTRGLFQPGRASNGHHLIIDACASCHVAFRQVPNQKCLACHQLQLAENTHDPKIFDDLRWTSTLATLDVRRCVTCHNEHGLLERASAQARGACLGCHEDVPQVRASHRSLAADSCGRGGCHNYHDNSGLNDSFLKKHAGEPELLAVASVPVRTRLPRRKDAPIPEVVGFVAPDPRIIARWEASEHAAAHVGCPDCHQDKKTGRLLIALDDRSCRKCHEFEVSTFLRGKHGARVSAGLEPLRPTQTRLAMKPPSELQPREQGCATCHDPHSVDTRQAAVAACLACHDDEHSRSFRKSKHFTDPAAAVTCATCHLPRVIVAGGDAAHIAVNHDNSFTLRPREAMAKVACEKCHGVPFTLNSLYDPRLGRTNFQGKPALRHETLSMIDALLARDRARGR